MGKVSTIAHIQKWKLCYSGKQWNLSPTMYKLCAYQKAKEKNSFHERVRKEQALFLQIENLRKG